MEETFGCSMLRTTSVAQPLTVAPVSQCDTRLSPPVKFCLCDNSLQHGALPSVHTTWYISTNWHIGTSITCESKLFNFVLCKQTPHPYISLSIPSCFPSFRAFVSVRPSVCLSVCLSVCPCSSVIFGLISSFSFLKNISFRFTFKNTFLFQLSFLESHHHSAVHAGHHHLSAVSHYCPAVWFNTVHWPSSVSLRVFRVHSWKHTPFVAKLFWSPDLFHIFVFDFR